MDMKAITENTLIPISLVIVIAVGVVWLATLHAESRGNVESITKVEIKQDQYQRTLDTINTRLSRIEGKLGIADRHSDD